MSENSNSTNGNSWTLLTPEVKESGVENVGPSAEGLTLSKAPEPSAEAHSDLEKHSSEASADQLENETSTQHQSDPTLTHESEEAQEAQVTSPETSDGRAQLNAAHVDEENSVEDISSWTHEEQHGLTGHSESPVCPGTDVESFSDSYTHISPTSGSSSLPASACQEKDWFKSDESLRKTEESKEALETNGKEGDGLRKRKISHLGSLDKTEAEEDEEGEEEDFQPPQREEETVFSLNKCILAAVILLGLGTIFFSEADMDVKELRDPTNQVWLKSEASRETPVDLQPPDILSKQTKEDQQILILQEQLQQHQGELKAAQLLAEVGEKERTRREELEKEYERMKGELDKVPALQKELEQKNERMKEENERAKKELEAVPSLQRELEHLREKVSQLTQSTGNAELLHPVAASRAPSAGDKRDVPPVERQDTKSKKFWDKKSEEKEQSKGDKEWKKKKSGKKEGDKERREKVTEGERTKDQKDGKKDEKTGKRKEEKKEWKKDKNRNDNKKESEDKKDFKGREDKKEDKKWKKDKHVRQDERKDERKDSGNKKTKEEKEWKRKEEQKDWRGDKQRDRNDQKDWKEKKKDEKEWKKDEKEWKKEKSEGKLDEKKRKEFPKEYDRKEKEEKRSRERSKEGEGIKEEKKNKAQSYKHEGKKSHAEKEKERHRKETSSPTRLHSHHHQKYWRERIQHTGGTRDACGGVEECAHAEGLAPVRLQDFHVLLHSYLNKLQDHVEQSRKEQLRQLVEEFFSDGVFNHHQMPFREFVEDVGDILEDMAEGDESDSEAEDSEEEEDDDDDEMEDFEREAMEKFALPEEPRKAERKGEQKKERGRVRG